jgi:hypothetical protein
LLTDSLALSSMSFAISLKSQPWSPNFVKSMILYSLVTHMLPYRRFARIQARSRSFLTHWR